MKKYVWLLLLWCSVVAARPLLMFMRSCDSITPGLVFVGQYAFTPTGEPWVSVVFDHWCPAVTMVELN